jgi:hypothetical protein
MGPVYPNYLFFTVQEGKAQRIGDTIPGGDESGTYVSSQPSGFSSFHVSGMTGGSNFSSYSHEGVRGSTTAVADGNFADSPWSQVGIDPSGGTALVRTQKDGSGAWTTAYQRLDKTGAAETGWVTIDTGRHPVGAVGVALSGHVLVLESLDNPNWQARWLARDGTPLTGWFEGITGNSYPSIQFLVDGSLVVRFRTGSYPSGPAPWKFRVEDGKTVVSALPGWLAQRAAQNFYVVRGGRGYATWGSEGQCAGLEVVATSGKSCGCVAVADLGDLSSVGRDGSLIVPEPPANRGTCAYDLYLQLLK